MGDWLGYSFTDVLPFSRETYQRLFVLYNARFNPAFAIGLGLGIAALALLLRLEAWRQRLVLAAFGLCWLWISWAFQLQMLEPLLWMAGPFALAFALQSGLLLSAAALPAARIGSARLERGSRIGYAILISGVLLVPLLGLLADRSLSGLELFGTAPDPTVIATLGLALVLPPRVGLLLMPVPVSWCLVSTVLSWGLGSPLWPVPAVFATAAVAVLWRRARHDGGSVVGNGS